MSSQAKEEFEPILKFFHVKPSGNILKDIENLTEVMGKMDLAGKFIKTIFQHFDKVYSSLILG
jgi:hypothetical protein